MSFALPGLVKAAFSAGAGYEPQPLGSQFSEEGIRGYYTDLRSKTIASTARDPASLLPAALAQLGLGWLERGIGGEAAARDEAAFVASLLRQRAQAHDSGALAWPYLVSVPKYGLDPPWYSAMAQGQVASFFVRMHLYAHDPHGLDTALAALRGMRVLEPQLIASSASGPSLEEAPSGGRPSRILNGWIYALWGVRDVAIGCGDPASAALFDRSTTALLALLPDYDLGWWSRYSLCGPRHADVAKPYYHRLHLIQLEAMQRLTGFDAFADQAARWRCAATRRNALRAVSCKVVERLHG